MKADGLLERLALWLNLAPTPAIDAMFGMMSSRAVMAGQKLGIFRELARSARSVEWLANTLGLNVEGARHLLESLEALGHVTSVKPEYALTERSRKWVDPASPTYIGTCIEGNYIQWDWWSNLEEVVRTGQGFDMHAVPADDPRWRTYITAMFELARLSAPEVAARLKMPRDPKLVLDLAGGHGWFAAEICRRNPGCIATVLDLPGSARIGREIIAKSGFSDRVSHREGNILTDDLGGPYDAILAFQIIHHLTQEQNQNLFHRATAALNPGGVFAVLDYFAPPPGRKPDSAALLGLHFFLTSSAATYSIEQVQSWLRECGFRQLRSDRLRRMPIQTLIQARS